MKLNMEKIMVILQSFGTSYGSYETAGFGHRRRNI